ncbi:MAG TPA: phosphatidate cytidylyltransferase [Candidatus Dormibacteraeota bacterium]|nr:phosphatidate cytidylyltransferase [Candidatus Dormibacteraeota bacterium]
MMDAASRERLWGWQHALDAPFVRGFVLGLAVILVLVPLCIGLVGVSRKRAQERQSELWARYRSWLIFIPLMIGPILLGAGWTIGAVCLMSILCYREFARATGMFREPSISALVVIGILAITFAVADHWYAFFVAVTPLFVALLAAIALCSDRPKGYIQRVGLGVLAFLLFGVCFGHLAYFANDANFRSILIWLIVCVEMNDIFAYIVGKTMGRRKLAPNTSPNKTVAGALGALVLTTCLATGLGIVAFARMDVDSVPKLILLGMIVSISGQLGDLTLSSIKRDLGIKDWAATFPGHGGLLDRFNSLLFASPAAFHFIGYIQGIGLDQTPRIITHGG